MCNPVVSVIIATYRRTDTLSHAIESVINQTYKDIEIIVVDDNADEDYNQKVRNIVELLRSKYHVSIQLICNDANKGSAETRNIGIRASSGQYITFLDDDDIYLDSKIEKQLRFIIEQNADYCITDLFLYNEEGKLIDKRIRSYIKKTDKRSLVKYHFMHHITGTDAMMFKTSYITQIGGFPLINIGDEFYLMERAIENAGVFAYLPTCEIKAYVHTNDGGLSSGESKINGENELYKYKKAKFDQFDNNTIRYIKMRHYAVLAFAYLRTRNYGKCFLNCCKSFCFSPIRCVGLLLTKNRS